MWLKLKSSTLTRGLSMVFSNSVSSPSLDNFLEICELIGVKLTFDGVSEEELEITKMMAITKMEMDVLRKRKEDIKKLKK